MICIHGINIVISTKQEKKGRNKNWSGVSLYKHDTFHKSLECIKCILFYLIAKQTALKIIRFAHETKRWFQNKKRNFKIKIYHKIR